MFCTRVRSEGHGNTRGYVMKLCEVAKRVEHVCNYIIAGVESEKLRAKYVELCEARARAVALEKELKAMLEKYE